MTTDSKEISGSQGLFTAARRRWKIVLLVFVMVFSATILFTYLQKRTFEATATIELNLQKGEDGKEPSASDAIAYLESRALATQVVQRLNLGWHATASSPQLEVTIDQFVVSGSLPGLQVNLTGPKEFSVFDLSGSLVAKGVSGDLLQTEALSLLLHIHNGQAGQFLIVERQPVEHHIENLLSSLKVVPIEEDGKVLRIIMYGEDPEYIRDAINQLIEIYQASLLQESNQEAVLVDRQLAEVQNSLETAEKDLHEYRQQSGLSELAPQGERLIGKVTQLEQRKTGLEWQISQMNLAAERLQRAINTSNAFVAPRIEGFPQITDAATQLSALESRKQALLVDFTEAHPKVEEVIEGILLSQREVLSLYSSASLELTLEKQRLAENIANLDKQLNKSPESELTRRTRERESQAELLNFLQGKQLEIRETRLTAVDEVKIIDVAIAPETPIKPNKVLNLILGGVLALSLGLCSAFFLSVIDPTFKTIDEIRNKLNLPIYGVIPMIPAFEEDSELPVAVLSPKAPVVEAFRALRTRLHYVTGKQRHKIIMVTSTLPGEGKSTLSANLSVVLSTAGAKVLLIGCDLRRPSLHKVFRQKNEPGLVELLRDKKPISVRHLHNPRFDFLPAGIIPENPSEILGSERMRKFLDMARDLYDYVVIDAPPVLPVTDAEILAPLADVNLVVLEPCRVPEKAALQMVKSLQDVGAKISGIVINDKTGQGFKYYGSYSYYGNRNFAGYYGESLDELQDGTLESLVKKVWGKLNS